MKKLILCVNLFLLCFISQLFAGNSTLIKRPQVQAYINYLVKQYQFKQANLEKLFSEVKLQPSIITAIKKPYEAKPWYFYRKHFLTEKRIVQGNQFLEQHAKTLDQVTQEYGVPKDIIVAIIGVESHYGKHLGTYAVMDALSTLAFDYPPRAAFFKKELTQFLLLSREQKLDPKSIYGSYAGAIGQPQFMPSSYRHYAVDYSKNGKADLVANTNDVIASVGNYLQKNGWQRGGLIAVPAKVSGSQYKHFLNNDRKPRYNLSALIKAGVTPKVQAKGDPKVFLIELQSNEKNTQPEYWLGFHNLYVITRYNTSILYAMAVFSLGEHLKG